MKHSHFWLFVALGIVFWLNGVLVVRLLGQQLLTTGNPLLIVAFLVAIPITLITFAIAKYISKLAFGEMLRPVVVMTFTAT
jgi:Zn-dependent protease with chaperone function